MIVFILILLAIFILSFLLYLQILFPKSISISHIDEFYYIYKEVQCRYEKLPAHFAELENSCSIVKNPDKKLIVNTTFCFDDPSKVKDAEKTRWAVGYKIPKFKGTDELLKELGSILYSQGYSVQHFPITGCVKTFIKYRGYLTYLITWRVWSRVAEFADKENVMPKKVGRIQFQETRKG